ncbi:CPBP family intramembrane glutamic endopeptidase [Rubrobacter calidifluminis]|uniref:CPBP family intramembrane glutamic endopeptidase n=1 Tax=Rubrobacter calidifluminis TaxID=1392640 RepID=UPI002362EE71|nr:CPBP family intramembrane glutamic endopeptidase [Rubrobacter calidifluminis]
MRLAERAAVLYAALLGVGLLWRIYRGYEVFPVGAVGLAIPLGMLAAGVTVGFALLSYRYVRGVRELADELAPALVDGVRMREIVAISLFSGVGEEAFFRGGLQPEVGLLCSSVIFGLLHLGPDRRFVLWALWAALAGLVFGWLYISTGGLLACMLAHALHNGVMLSLWRHQRSKGS